VLRKYYDRRRDGWIQWKSEDFSDVEEDFKAEDLFRVCDQLAEYSLIDWRPLKGNNGLTINGYGKIAASGADVVEGTRESPVSINLDYSQHTVSITSSSNVQVGSGNIQGISIHVQRLVEAIDSADVSPQKKRGSKECLAQISRTSCCDCDTRWVGIRHPLGFFDLACRFLPSSSSIQVLFGANPTISSPKQLSYSCQRQENESSRYFYQMRPPGRSESRSPHALTQQLTL